MTKLTETIIELLFKKSPIRIEMFFSDFNNIFNNLSKDKFPNNRKFYLKLQSGTYYDHDNSYATIEKINNITKNIIIYIRMQKEIVYVKYNNRKLSFSLIEPNSLDQFNNYLIESLS